MATCNDSKGVSEFKEAAVSYISGYVAKMCEKKLHHCKGCSQALTEKDQEPSCFMSVKDRGGLKKKPQNL